MTCYICGSDNFFVRPGTVRDNNSLVVIECNNCGLVTLSSTDHIGQSHYEESKMHGEEPISIKKWLQETNLDDERRFDMLKQKLVSKNVLDFGCGNGGFLFKAKKLTTVVEGVELEKRVQPFFNENKIEVWTSLKEALDKTTYKFDLITSFHVFEHLIDPRMILKELMLLLKDDGELIIEVPSSDDALLTLYNCEPFTKFTYWSQHIYLFNPHTLSELVKQSGFKVKWVKQVQRYTLSNHLYWLSKGKPGGHDKWAFLNNQLLDSLYASHIGSLGKCDTLMMGVGKI